MSNLATSAENRRTIREPSGPDKTASAPEPAGQDQPNPEAILLSNEARARADDYMLGFWGSLETEPELQHVVAAIIDIDEKVTPAKIAETLCVPVEEIYVRRKRLQRRLEGYQGEYLARHPVGAEGQHV